MEGWLLGSHLLAGITTRFLQYLMPLEGSPGVPRPQPLPRPSLVARGQMATDQKLAIVRLPDDPVETSNHPPG